MQRSSNASCRQHAGSLGGERSREMLAGCSVLVAVTVHKELYAIFRYTHTDIVRLDTAIR